MSVQFDFKNRKVLVTGGANGIGLEIAKKFVASGASVFVLDQDEAKLKEVKDANPSVTVVHADLLDWNSTKCQISAAGPFHHLVNNAGTCMPVEYLLDIKSESVDKVFGVNFKGTLGVTQAVAKGMIDNKLENVTVVNLSSISDQVGVSGLTTYSCSKAAITMLTKCMALELKEHGIRVNCVRPAMVNTNHVKRAAQNKAKVHEELDAVNGRKLIDRLVEMNEVADAVLYLSSTASSMSSLDGLILHIIRESSRKACVVDMVIQMSKVSVPVDALHSVGYSSRDPQEINKHLQPSWESVIGEPEGLRSPEWAWKFSSEVYTFVQAATYRLLVVILAPLFSFTAAVFFGILHFLQVWCLRPILKFFYVVFTFTRSFIELVLHGTVGPFLESFGLLCSRVKVRHQRVYDVKDEPQFPFVI